MWCFDCEVFYKDWMFVFIDIDDTNKREIIINDSEKLKTFYDQNKHEVFVGYNARSYDQFIFKAILCGINPKLVNDYIIVQGNKGGMYSKKFRDIDLLIYDCMIDRSKSLKQLEAFMGNDIRESSVDFNINRKLTKEELESTIYYCIHDVEQTIEVFKLQPEEFESQSSLIKAFDLPENYLNKTKAQLSAIILGANNEGNRFDEFEISFPDTLVLSDKYKYIYDWYNKRINRNYFMSLKTNVYGIPHIFAWGGIHGALSNYAGEGFYIMSDVASLYPSIMIEYGYLSRNVPDSKRFTQIRDTRLELKKAKNPMQLPYKIVLNSTYGAMKDKYNSLYDPLMANNVCVTGQLLLLDLIDKLEQQFGSKCELIQSNTDGILVKLPSKEYYTEYVSVCNEWSKRTRLDLEHDIYVKVYQKDVNNYVIVSEDGHCKSKGAYVKELNDLDNDLPVVNKALLSKLIYDTDISEFINKCNHLKEYQKVVKIGKDYEYGMHGEQKIRERVLRIFSSTDEKDAGIFKYRNSKTDKVANTPDISFIFNDDVNNKGVTSKLDKQWYIDLANKRYDDFMSQSDITEKLDIYEVDFDNLFSFTDVIECVFLKSNCKPKEFKNLILLNYFYKFGSIKKLTRWYELYTALYEKKGIQIDKLVKLNIPVEEAGKYGNVAKKSITKFNGTGLFLELVKNLSDDEYTLKEISEMQLKEFSTVTYSNEELHSGYCVVLDIETYANSTSFILRSFKEGKKEKFKLHGMDLEMSNLHNGDIIKIGKTERDKKSKGRVFLLKSWHETNGEFDEICNFVDL